MVTSGKITPGIRAASVAAAMLVHAGPFFWLTYPRATIAAVSQPAITRVVILPPPSPPPPPEEQEYTPPPPPPPPEPELTQKESPVTAEPEEQPETPQEEPEPQKPEPQPEPEPQEPEPQPIEESKPEIPQTETPPTSEPEPVSKTENKTEPQPDMARQDSEISDGIPDTPPAAQHEIKPVYPLDARKNGIEGSVTCVVAISKRGKAESVKISKSSGHQILDDAAIRAVMAARFVPAKRGHKSIEAKVRLTFDFKLDIAR